MYGIAKLPPVPAARILIIDDVPAFLDEASAALSGAGLRTVRCDDPRRAAELVANKKPDVIITTLVMKHLGGFDVIRAIRGGGHRQPIVMVTGYGTPEGEREAARLGCCDYLTKPLEPAELVARVRRAVRLAEGWSDDAIRIGQMVTRDPGMRAVMQTVETVADSDCRVLVLGETGTGKQLVAQSLHARGRRAAEPFVGVNCSAIPENLLESELFGHRRGAFTDAHRDRTGRFSAAGKGTLFLDEIGEMPLSLQAKLLHVLDDGEFTPVGADKPLRSRARVIAATNRDLHEEVQRGRFRSDLYYRLNVVSVRLPPLRDRPTDVPVLIDRFVEEFTRDSEKIRLSNEAMEVLLAYAWPGNVRELQNTVERLAVMHAGEEIRPEHLPPRFFRQAESDAGGIDFSGPWRAARQRFEAAYVRRLIHHNGGNLAAAARSAGLDRAQFYRMAKRHDLLPPG